MHVQGASLLSSLRPTASPFESQTLYIRHYSNCHHKIFVTAFEKSSGAWANPPPEVTKRGMTGLTINVAFQNFERRKGSAIHLNVTRADHIVQGMYLREQGAPGLDGWAKWLRARK
jgi:hypothetical protein